MESSSEEEASDSSSLLGLSKNVRSRLTDEENKKREQEKWAMLAGQAVYKLESKIFQEVLPENLIKPHIFPRTVSDMESLIDNYPENESQTRLENAGDKWRNLKTRLGWNPSLENVLAIIKKAYLNISNPLEVMMRLDKESGKSADETNTAFRNSLPQKLWESGKTVVAIMIKLELLKENDIEGAVNKT
ncbi:uncharacterized protein LOC117108075 [Anneissia japonica]|uniref:uncharacterized protein LOC117108075 n=1 Tax=Anneissia japonica TaxID=1529436 RepID=UPI001425B920|nr:uncharacterized protein LOC117108075 [Anneissia japonica]